VEESYRTYKVRRVETERERERERLEEMTKDEISLRKASEKNIGDNSRPTEFAYND